MVLSINVAIKNYQILINGTDYSEWLDENSFNCSENLLAPQKQSFWSGSMILRKDRGEIIDLDDRTNEDFRPGQDIEIYFVRPSTNQLSLFRTFKIEKAFFNEVTNTLNIDFTDRLEFLSWLTNSEIDILSYDPEKQTTIDAGIEQILDQLGFSPEEYDIQSSESPISFIVDKDSSTSLVEIIAQMSFVDRKWLYLDVDGTVKQTQWPFIFDVQNEDIVFYGSRENVLFFERADSMQPLPGRVRVSGVFRDTSLVVDPEIITNNSVNEILEKTGFNTNLITTIYSGSTRTIEKGWLTPAHKEKETSYSYTLSQTVSKTKKGSSYENTSSTTNFAYDSDDILSLVQVTRNSGTIEEIENDDGDFEYVFSDSSFSSTERFTRDPKTGVLSTVEFNSFEGKRIEDERESADFQVIEEITRTDRKTTYVDLGGSYREIITGQIRKEIRRSNSGSPTSTTIEGQNINNQRTIASPPNPGLKPSKINESETIRETVCDLPVNAFAGDRPKEEAYSVNFLVNMDQLKLICRFYSEFLFLQNRTYDLITPITEDLFTYRPFQVAWIGDRIVLRQGMSVSMTESAIEVSFSCYEIAKTSEALTVQTPTLPLSTGILALPDFPDITYVVSATIQPIVYTAINGTKPYTYSAINLPPGITINSTTGILSGKTTTTGVYNTEITVTDNILDTATSTFVFTVIAKPDFDYQFELAPTLTNVIIDCSRIRIILYSLDAGSQAIQSTTVASALISRSSVVVSTSIAAQKITQSWLLPAVAVTADQVTKQIISAGQGNTAIAADGIQLGQILSNAVIAADRVTRGAQVNNTTVAADTITDRLSGRIMRNTVVSGALVKQLRTDLIAVSVVSAKIQISLGSPNATIAISKIVLSVNSFFSRQTIVAAQSITFVDISGIGPLPQQVHDIPPQALGLKGDIYGR